MLGEIADWIETTTPRRRNRPFAIAAAVVIIGTVLGRTLFGPTQTGTNLYITCLGESGEGKDWPLKCVPLVLSACGLAAAVGSAEWKSQVALENAIYDRPCHVAIADEIGQALFSQIMGKKVAQHQAGISATLRSLWSISGADYTTSASAARSSKIIRAPSLSIFGASTPQEFFNSLSDDAQSNGFLNRLLLIRGKAGVKTSARKVLADITVPPRIVERLQALLHSEGGNLGGSAVALTSNTKPARATMAWADEATSDAFEALFDEWETYCRAESERQGLVGRVAEMAQRLAVIHAASRDGRGASVGAADWQWGMAVAKHSAHIMLSEVSERMAVNQNQADSQLIGRIIRDACRRDPDGISRSILMKKINGRIHIKLVDTLLRALIEAETIAFVERPSTGGRPSQRYVYLGERRMAA